jgi:hypothetical protein
VSVESGADAAPPGDRYVFASDLPVPPVAHGTSVVVRGDAAAGPGAVAMRLLEPVSRRQGGALLVETDDTQRGIATRWAASTDVPLSRLAVVSCEGGRRDPPADLGASGCVSQPSDLTGIGIQYAKIARSFTEGPRGRLRVGLDSVSTLQLYCDDVQTVYRFLHTFTGRIRTSGQLGVFVFNPEMHDERVASVVTQPFDAAVDVRLDGDGHRELRVTGVADHSPTWTPL